ncbi:MAG: YwaF family protein [Butyrivibrio sp.]|nr:YwaF family protein [Butyrivibrio sp.]
MGIAMFEYFWKQQDDIPAGMGYPLFGVAHLLSVAITLFFVVILARWILGLGAAKRRPGDGLDAAKRRPRGGSEASAELRGVGPEVARRRRIIRGIPLFMVGLEVFKDLFLVHVGRFGIGYLPLHICSIGIFVFLFREWGALGMAQSSRESVSGGHAAMAKSSRESEPGGHAMLQRMKDVFGEIAFILIMPASFTALLFADWTVYYPVLNFMNIYSYIWHGLLILYPVTLWLGGEIKPSIRHIHYVLLFLCVVVLPIYAFDKHFGCNYFFVNWPVPDSPLSWLASFMGNPGYLVGYAFLTLAVILLMYFGVWAIGGKDSSL